MCVWANVCVLYASMFVSVYSCAYMYDCMHAHMSIHSIQLKLKYCQDNKILTHSWSPRTSPTLHYTLKAPYPQEVQNKTTSKSCKLSIKTGETKSTSIYIFRTPITRAVPLAWQVAEGHNSCLLGKNSCLGRRTHQNVVLQVVALTLPLLKPTRSTTPNCSTGSTRWDVAEGAQLLPQGAQLTDILCYWLWLLF